MKNLNSFSITFLVFLILVSFLFTSFSSAQTLIPDFQTVIKQLQNQIKLLNQQIQDLQSRLKKTEEEVEVVKAELKFTRSLKKGESSDEVKQLQEFLKQFPDIYPEGIVTGFFGELTERAVKKFQERQGIVSSGTAETTGYGRIGPKTIQKLNEFSVSTTPAIQAIPAVSGVLPAISAIPAIPASPSLPFHLASASQPIVNQVIPAPPASASAIPAIPATPAQPSGSTPTSTAPISSSQTASISATKTPTPTPTPTSTTTTILDLGIVGLSGLSSSYQANSSFQVNILPYNYTCRFCQHTTPPTTLKVYYTPWYPNDLPNIEVGPHYGEQTLAVPPIPQWQSVTVNWQGVASAPAGKYYFVANIDPDNVLAEANENNNGIRSEFSIIQSSTPTPTPTPTATPTPSPQAISCTDSDGGYDYYTKGNVTITFNTGEVLNEYEFCESSTDVKERYCDKSTLLYNTVSQRCLFGCVDGACLRTPASTSSVSFSPSTPATANILDALKSILQNLNNLLFQLR